MPKTSPTIRPRTPASLSDAIARLPKRLPANLRPLMHQVQRRVRALERQLEKGRAERERRWEEQQLRFRGEVARLLRRLEKAIAPGPRSRRRKA